jgi:hypothetical protein
MDGQEISIRSPVAPQRPKESPPPVRLDRPLKGLRVGIRTDTYWQSWLHVSDEWSKMLKQEGAEPVVLRVGIHIGEEGQHTHDIVDAWASSIDCAVVGLAN